MRLQQLHGVHGLQMHLRRLLLLLLLQHVYRLLRRCLLPWSHYHESWHAVQGRWNAPGNGRLVAAALRLRVSAAATYPP